MVYAGDFSPLSDITLALLLKRCWIEFEYVPELGVVEVVWPAAFDGAHQMMLDGNLTPGERRFALRHGLGHVLAGHVHEGACHDADWSGWRETIADIFAALDIIPDWRLDELRAAKYSAEEMARWVYCEIARYAPAWPPARIRDRTQLRLVLAEIT